MALQLLVRHVPIGRPTAQAQFVERGGRLGEAFLIGPIGGQDLLHVQSGLGERNALDEEQRIVDALVPLQPLDDPARPGIIGGCQQDQVRTDLLLRHEQLQVALAELQIDQRVVQVIGREGDAVPPRDRCGRFRHDLHQPTCARRTRRELVEAALGTDHRQDQGAIELEMAALQLRHRVARRRRLGRGRGEGGGCFRRQVQRFGKVPDRLGQGWIALALGQ
jgi:hypothetical protein